MKNVAMSHMILLQTGEVQTPIPVQNQASARLSRRDPGANHQLTGQIRGTLHLAVLHFFKKKIKNKLLNVSCTQAVAKGRKFDIPEFYNSITGEVGLGAKEDAHSLEEKKEESRIRMEISIKDREAIEVRELNDM